MKLIWFEFKKMFLQKNMVFLVLILVLVNAGKICINGRLDPVVTESKVHWQLPGIVEAEDELKGEITPETMQMLMDVRSQIMGAIESGTGWDSEASTYDELYPHYAYLYEYHIANDEKLEQAGENIEFYEKHGNEYDASVNRLFQRQYAGRFVRNYSNSEDYAILFSYHFSSFLLLVLSLAGSAQLVWKERKTGIYDLLQTTLTGKTRLHFAKIAAFMVWLAIAAAILFGEDYAVHSVLFHLEGLMQPLYAVEAYELCSFGGSIMSYTIFLYGIRLFAAICAGLIFVVLNTLFRGVFVPICADIFFMFGCILTSEQTTSTVTFLNPAFIMQPDRYLQNFLAVRIGDHAVSAMTAACCAMLLLTLIAGAAIHVLWSRNIRCTLFQKRR